MIDKRGIVPYNETHTLLNYHFTMRKRQSERDRERLWRRKII